MFVVADSGAFFFYRATSNPTASLQSRLAVTLALVLTSLASGCCELYHASYYPSVSAAPDGYHPVQWGGRTEGRALRFAHLSLFRWDPPGVPDPPMMELHGIDGRYDISGSLLYDLPGDSEDCGNFDRIVYDLGPPPAGEYFLVHRLSSGPTGVELAIYDSSVTSFEGEPALVTILVFDD